MNTAIRIGVATFYDDVNFKFGLSRSGHFNKREAQELHTYGKTLQGLENGSLTPCNEEEKQFVLDIHSKQVSHLYLVNLWRKYLEATQKYLRHHSFMSSESYVPKAENTAFFD